jgi:SAM-dependent methyltransferase
VGAAVLLPPRFLGHQLTSTPNAADLQTALTQTARALSPRACETVLCENFYKHILELRLIRDAVRPDGTVCDLGGGLGINLIALRRLGHRGRLLLIDRLDEYEDRNRMGSYADASALLVGHDIEIVRQDFWADATLPLPDSMADVTTCFDVVEHLPGHPLRQLRELHRVLRPAGTCIIGGPNSVSLMKRLKLMSGRHPYTTIEAWLTDPFYEHFREYSREEYMELLRRAAFEQVASAASAAVTPSRARAGFHRRRLPVASPIRLALWALAAAETALPPLRHTIYAWGRRPAGRAE